jgi:translation initiation factor 1
MAKDNWRDLLCPKCHQLKKTCTCSAEPAAPSKATVVRVGRETKGRRGKGVTIVSDLPLDESGLEELATKLKTRLGTGGTVKDRRIEIQGDHRDRIVAELEGLCYRVKRAGG